MFTWNPAYTEVAKIVFSHSGFALRDVPDEQLAVVVLRKNEQHEKYIESLKKDVLAKIKKSSAKVDSALKEVEEGEELTLSHGWGQM